jgi:hypothetical protein
MTETSRMQDNFAERLSLWMDQYGQPELRQRAVDLPLRQNIVTMMTYIQEHEVVGIKKSGNIPRKHIRGMVAQFVDPPVLDEVIGDRVYKLRTEYDIWPLRLLHALVEVGDLVLTGEGRRWTVTRTGERFLETDPMLQAVGLLQTWWHRTNWLYAYPFAGLGEVLPYGFESRVLARLRFLPVNRRIDHNDFADRLIARTGLTWINDAAIDKQNLLRHAVKHMVTDILRDFWVIEPEYQYNETIGTLKLQKLIAFRMTEFGRALLEGVALGEA